MCPSPSQPPLRLFTLMRSSIGSSKREILRSRSFLEVRAEKLIMAVCVKYTSKKMWHVANLVKGLSVDEALKQLDSSNTKGNLIAVEVIRVKEHCLEYRSNLWLIRVSPEVVEVRSLPSICTGLNLTSG